MAGSGTRTEDARMSPVKARASKGGAAWAAIAGMVLSSAVQADVTRQLRFTLSVHNPTSSMLEDQRLWFAVPLDLGRQELRKLQISEPKQFMNDKAGNGVAALEYKQFPPFGTRIVNVTAQVKLAAKAEKETLRSRSDYLVPERFVESDAPEIVSLARQLKRPDDMQTGKAIYDWLTSNLTYAGFIAADRGALQGLRERKGDCTEYAYLAAALARANGIPARVVGGYVLDRDSVIQPDAYHNWAELYLDGAWRIADAQRKTWLVHPDRYVAFRILAPLKESPLGTAHRFKAQGNILVRMD